MTIAEIWGRLIALIGLRGKVAQGAPPKARVIDCSSWSCAWVNGRPRLLYDPSAMTADDAMEVYRRYKAKWAAYESPLAHWQRLERERLARA